MGKSTAAAAFRRAGIPVFDADAAVHRLQARGGRAVPAIAAAFPGTVRDGAVDRPALRARVIGDEAAIRRLEAIVHPLVRAEERAFLARARRAGRRVAVLDIPLLFEAGGDRRVDWVVTVSAPRRRAARPRGAAARHERGPGGGDHRPPDAGCGEAQRARVVVQTGLSRYHALRQLRRLIRELR